MPPSAPSASFEASSRSIVRAVGFTPELSSRDAGWNGVGLFAWRGLCREATFAPFDEPVLVYHVGGAPAVPVKVGRHWDRETHPGLVTVIPPSTPVGWDIRGEVYSRSVHLSPQLFARGEEEGASRAPAVAFRCGVRDPILLSGIQALELELQRPSQNGSLYAESVGQFLALHLLRDAAPVPVLRPRRRTALGGRVLQRVLDRLEGSLETGVSLKTLAAEAQLSPSYFSTAFREATGLTPHRYLTQRRLVHARGLLSRSGLSIADVALRCGFSSQAHFTQYFHREHGVTPRAFRRNGNP